MKNKQFFIFFLFIFTLSTINIFASGQDDISADGPLSQKIASDCSTKEKRVVNKSACKAWCEKAENWKEDCKDIGVQAPTNGSEIKELNNDKKNDELEPLIIRLRNTLEKLDPTSTLELPNNFTGFDSYAFDFKFKAAMHSQLNPVFFAKEEDLKEKNQEKAIKTIILDSLDLTDPKNSYETALIQFRNNWLSLQAPGSIDNTDIAFEPKAFHALATSKHENRKMIHKLYSLLGENHPVYTEFNALNDVVVEGQRQEKLKNLQTAIKEYLEKNLTVKMNVDKWEDSTDLTFRITIGTMELNPTLADIEINQNFFIKSAEYTKYRDVLNIPIAYFTNTAGRQSTELFRDGIIIFQTGIVLNDNLKNINPITKAEWTADEMQNSNYRIYMHQLNEIQSKLDQGVDITNAIEVGSLLDNLLRNTLDTLPTQGQSSPGVLTAISNLALAWYSRDGLPSGGLGANVPMTQVMKVFSMDNKLFLFFGNFVDINRPTKIQWFLRDNSFKINFQTYSNDILPIADGTESNIQSVIPENQAKITVSAGNTLENVKTASSASMIKITFGGTIPISNPNQQLNDNIIRLSTIETLHSFIDGTDAEKAKKLAKISKNLVNMFYVNRFFGHPIIITQNDQVVIQDDTSYLHYDPLNRTMILTSKFLVR